MSLHILTFITHKRCSRSPFVATVTDFPSGARLPWLCLGKQNAGQSFILVAFVFCALFMTLFVEVLTPSENKGQIWMAGNGIFYWGKQIIHGLAYFCILSLEVTNWQSNVMSIAPSSQRKFLHHKRPHWLYLAKPCFEASYVSHMIHLLRCQALN